MNPIRTIRRYLRSLVQRRNERHDIDEELRFHIEQRTAENIAAGMSPGEAQREARKRFGNVQSVREECSEVRRASFGEDVLKDIRFGMRVLVKNPLFTVVAVLTLAIGIGANTALFSATRTVLFDPLPVSDPDRFIQLTAGGPGICHAALESVRQQTNLFSRYGIYDFDSLTLQGETFPEPIQGLRVTPEFFSLWTLRPKLGRTFGMDEANPGRDDVIILSYQVWQSRFGGDPAIIGQAIRFKEGPMTVVGVMPPSFSFPSGYFLYWRPFAAPAVERNSDGSVFMNAYLDNTGFIAEMKPGVQKGQVQAYLDVLARGLAAESPGTATDPIRARELREIFVKPEVRRTLWALLGASALTLLIACANVANLQLARTESRQHELAVRSAVGAGRLRLMRQLLTENILLAVIGGMAGLAVTAFALKLLEQLIPPDLPRFKPVSINFGAFFIASAVSIGTGIAFGLAPALLAGRAAVTDALKLSGAASTRSLGKARFGRSLAAGQIALALLLLICAGLMVRTVAGLLAVNPGFDPHNLVRVYPGVDLNRYVWDGQEHSAALDAAFANMRERVAGLLGEKSAAVGLQVSGDSDLSIIPDGTARPIRQFYLGTDGANLLEVMRVPLLVGRWLERTDANPALARVLVSSSAARLLWPGENPLGKRLWSKGEKDAPLEVVGVVGDTRLDRYDEAPPPTVYKVLANAPLVGLPRFLVFRTPSQPGARYKAVGEELKAAGADASPPAFVNLEEQLKASTAGARTLMLYLSTFAGVAVFLSAIGLYGVLAYSVARRTKEIGTRLALGASRGDVLGMIVLDGFLLACFGTIAGMGAAVAVTRVLRAFLFGVTPQDPVTFAAAALLIDAIAMLACWLPARKAANVDPMVALRYE
jgi:putative ABC transport system permease protein